MTFFQDTYLLNLSKTLGELGQKIEMHLYFLAKFTKSFRQFQQVKVLKKITIACDNAFLYGK